MAVPWDFYWCPFPVDWAWHYQANRLEQKRPTYIFMFVLLGFCKLNTITAIYFETADSTWYSKDYKLKQTDDNNTTKRNRVMRF